MNNHLEQASLLQQSAKQLLSSKMLIEELSKFGPVNFTGSYALGLMVWPDIDMQVEIDASSHDRVKVFSELAYKFLQDSDFKSVKLINFTPGKKPGMPTGMYMGLTCKHNKQSWKIDIWALDPEHIKNNVNYMNQVKSKLTKDLKQFIIDWKHKLLREGRVPQLGSYMLYKAILFEGMKGEDEILKYLIENGVKL